MLNRNNAQNNQPQTNQFQNNHDQDQPKSPTIEELYPDFTAEEQAEAADTLKRYLNLVWRIYQRLRRESFENSEKIDENPFKR
jgi:hypothetical protein